MSTDYGEPIVQAGEEVAIAIKVLTAEIGEVRKTLEELLVLIDVLVQIQRSRP